jgi:hypothetical protein
MYTYNIVSEDYLMSTKSTPIKQTRTKKIVERKHLPSLEEFRKSIHIKGEPLSRTVIKGRG